MILLFVACMLPQGDLDTGTSAQWSGLSVKGESACAFSPDGELTCWGQAAEYSASLAVREIALGNNHSCGLNVDGRVHCAGNDSYGETEPPTTAMSQVAVGDYQSCGLDLQGEVHCWGWERIAIELPPGPYTRLSMSGYQLCGLDLQGQIRCAGSLSTCGDGVPPEGQYVAMDQSGCHGCALDEQGIVTCWNATPDLVPPGNGWLEIAAGDGFTCALDNADDVYCFGPAAPEPLIEHPIHELDAGSQHLLCGLDSDGMLCWGQGAVDAGMP